MLVAMSAASVACIMIGSESYDASDGEMQSAKRGARAGICDRRAIERDQ
jgi:hypothetical protein